MGRASDQQLELLKGAAEKFQYLKGLNVIGATHPGHSGQVLFSDGLPFQGRNRHLKNS